MRKSKLHHQRALCRGTCVGVIIAFVFALSGQVELAAEQSQRSSNGRPPQRTQGPPTDPGQGAGSPQQGPPTDPGQGAGSPSQGPPTDPGQGAGPPSQGRPGQDPGQRSPQPSSRIDVLVGFRNVPGPAEQALVRRAGGQIKYSFRLVSAIASSMPAQALNGLRNNPTVTVIEPDGLVFALDPELDSAWGVRRIGAGLVHASGQFGAGVRVAVIDTGIDYTHLDLHTYAGGFDFVNGDADPMDDHYHGTHVAGTIAASDNGTGVVGVAPLALLYGLKVLSSSGSGSWSNVIAALEWAVDNGIQVTNNSYGSGGNPGSIVQAAFANSAAAGIVHIGSAGNSGSCDGTDNTVGYPARYPSVLAVAATNATDTRACFSSTGPDVEIAAPGVSILSTYPGNRYAWLSGTSMASPHVAGVAALVIAAGITDANQDGRINDEVRAALIATALDLGEPGRDTFYGFGLVDAVEAVAAATPPTPEVRVTLTADQPTYTLGSDTHLLLTAAVTDETGQALSGLDAFAFVTSLDAQVLAGDATFTESATPGTYTATMALPADPASYTVAVAVTDARSATGTGSTAFDVEPAPLEPVVRLVLSTDRSSYVIGDGLDARVTAVLTDELDDAISGLGASGFVTVLGGQVVAGSTFGETATPGTYDAVVTLPAVDGSQTIEVTVTDLRGVSASAVLTVTVEPTPRVDVVLTTDRTSYVLGAEELAVLTVAVTDERGGPISGLGAVAFSTSVDGNPQTGPNFVETAAAGVYTADLLLPLDAGTYSVQVGVADARGVSGTGTVQLLVLPPVSELALHLVLSTDRSSYLIGADPTAIITAAVVDEYGDAVAGVSAADFATSLDGGPLSGVTFQAGAPGAYVADIAVPVNLGTYTLSVTATDARDVSGTGTTSIVVDAAPASVPDPVLNVLLTTDKPRYQSGVDTAARVTAVVSDEQGQVVLGLPGQAFVATLDGAGAIVAFGERAPGTYVTNLPLPAEDGSHVLTVTVTDGRGSSGLGVALFTVDPPEALVQVALSTDRGSYRLDDDTVGVLTAVVTDEQGQAITGLGSGAFLMSLAGASSVEGATFGEIAPGTYVGDLSLPDVEGAHEVAVTVTDTRGMSGSATAEFVMTKGDVTSIAEIGYTTNGGRANDMQLVINVRLVDSAGAPVSGAEVSVRLERDGDVYGEATHTSRADGVATFRAIRFPGGHYETFVTAVEGGPVWDGVSLPNSYVKAGGDDRPGRGRIPRLIP